jgi:hypothetical protein
MTAEEARKRATLIQESGVDKIIEKIIVQAEKGQFGLTISDYSLMNEHCRKILESMGYKVKWHNTQRDDGYWQINW